MDLLVDSTGLKLCGADEWLVEKHGAKTRWSWRKLHIGLDADTGQIVAAMVASFTADGAYDLEGVSAAVVERHPAAATIVPPRCTAAPSETAATAPTQRDHPLHSIAEHGRAAWQITSCYTTRARAEAAIGIFKQMIGDGLRAHTDRCRATEVGVAVHALNRILDRGSPISVHIA